MEIAEMLKNKIVDLLFIAETKSDSSFQNTIFEVPGYKLERKDRNIRGGGIAAYTRSDVASSRRKDLECDNLENIIIEVNLEKKKICFISVYRPPSMKDDIFCDYFTKTLDKCIILFDYFTIIGDLNYDLSCQNKGRPLQDLMEIFNLTHIVKNDTCFVKNCKSSLLDVILTNSSKLFLKTLNFPTGISDCQNMISSIINCKTPTIEKQKVYIRSFRNFDPEAYNQDLLNLNIPHSKLHDKNEVNNVYCSFESDVVEVINKHAPQKLIYVKKNSVPYMNRNLRKAIYAKNMLRK